MQKILNAINSQMQELEVGNEYMLPDPADVSAVIQDYLVFRQEQFKQNQRWQYLQDLRELVESEVLKGESAERERAELAESAANAKNKAAETANALKQLSKMDLCSPDAADVLLNLTKIRRYK